MPLVGHGEEKLVLAHKMYGFPFLDISGDFGVSSRDNYIIKAMDNEERRIYSLKDLVFLRYFLSTKFALFIYSTTAYRMKYLEKYAFEFIPDLCHIPFWREKIDKIYDLWLDNKMGENINNNICTSVNELIYDFFQVTNGERENIEKMHKTYLMI